MVRLSNRYVLPLVFMAMLLALMTGMPVDVYAQKKNNKKKSEIEASGIAQERVAVLNLMNKYRTSLGKPALVMNDIISNDAYEHSARMASGTIAFGHAGFDDRIGKLLKQLGATGGAENVAFSTKGAGSVMHNWLNSDGHRENIEGDYNYVGIGIAPAKNGYRYYTVIFLKKK